MFELDLNKLKRTLCKGVRILVAIRMLAQQIDKDDDGLKALEMEVREASGDVQKAVRLMDEGECVTLRKM